MTPDEIKEMIASAVKEATEPLTAKISELEASVKEAEEAREEEAKKEEAAADEPAQNEELEAFKSEVNAKIDGLTQKLGGTKATALKGQDGDETNEPAEKSLFSDRDAFGRKTR